MLIKKITLLLCCLIAFTQVAKACTCIGESSFCEELNDTSDDGWDHPTHVLTATKLKDTLHGMIVLPVKSFINEVEPTPMVVWGDPGHLCRPYTSNFEIGETLVIAIRRMDIAQYDHEEAGDFFMSFCGVSYLRIEDDQVKGPITLTVNSMSMEDFEVYMETEAYKENCPIISSTQTPIAADQIKIFPNPVQDEIIVQLEIPEQHIQQMKIYDSSGQLKIVKEYPGKQQKINADLSGLASGIYFVHLSVNDRKWQQKIVVQ